MGEFAAHLQEVLRDFGDVALRRMFGGHGVFRDGLMIGIVVDDTLYLKADAETCGEFESRGLAPFEYTRQGRRVSLSYRRAPEEVLESPQAAAHWARLAYAAALRARPKRAAARRP